LKKILDGEDFEMKKRECYIYEIELLSFSYPEASFRAIVSP
jgi:tRNA U55 pseudouridine synthase TruB